VEAVARGERSRDRSPKPHRARDLKPLLTEADDCWSEPDADQLWEEWKQEERERAEQLDRDRQLRQAREAEDRRREEEELAEEMLSHVQGEVAEFMESLTPRQMGRLSDEEFDDLVALFED
jgi:mono/diheme cytochrome c family protein